MQIINTGAVPDDHTGDEIHVAFTKCNTNFAGIDTDLTAAWVDLNQASTDINVVEGRTTTVEGRATTLEGRATTLEGRATTVEGRATALESDMTAVEGRATTLETRATAVEGRATTVEGRATTLEGRATTLEGGMAASQSAADAAMLTGRRNGYTVNGQLSKKEYDTATSEWVISHPLFRIELGSGRSYVQVAAATDMRIPVSRTYYVDLTGAAAGATLTGQVTPTDSLSSSYGVGAFVDDLRLPLFTHRATGGNRGHGGWLADTYKTLDEIGLVGKVDLLHLATDLKNRIDYQGIGRTWFTVTSGTRVTYNPITRTLAWDGEILTPALIGSSTRVKLAAGSVVIPDDNFEVVYLDLTRAATTDIVSPADAVRVGRYLDSDGEQFTGEVHQVPMFYRRYSKVYGACPGFLPVVVVDAVTPAEANTKLQFTKSATASANIFIKGAGPSNWLEFIFARTVVPFDAGATANSQSDTWRFHSCYETNSEWARLRGGTDIISSGEWECALRESGGKPDAIGGYHGDELQTNSFFLVDGIYYDQTALINTAAKEIQFVQESVIYSCNTQTPICNHVKRYRITTAGIELTQDFEWLAATELDAAWLSMLPIKRNLDITTGELITDHGIRYPGYAVEDLSTYTADGSARVFTSAAAGDSMHVYGETSGISAEMILLETPGLPNADFHFSDASAYNKIYYNAIGAAAGSPTYTTAIGEKWRQKTLYKVTTRN